MSNYAVTDPPGSGGAGGPATIIDGVNGTIIATVKDYVNSNPLTVITVDTNGDPVSAGGGGLTDAQLRASAVPVSGPLTDAQLRAVAVPVSAASLPLPTGAATSVLQTQPGVDIGDVTINNAAGAAAVNVQDGGNSLTIDAANLDVALSTRLKPADTLTGVTTVTSITNVVHVDDNAGSLTVDGPLTDGQLRASAVPVSGTITSNAGTGTFTTKEIRAATPTQSSVAASASNVTVLAANANRLGATVFNDPTGGAGANLFLKLGATASATSFTARLVPNAYYEIPYNYTGIIDGIWASPAGNARITEFTA